MLKAIVFDFDGVLVDSEPLHYKAFLAVGRTLGMEFDYAHYLDQLVGFDDHDGFSLMLDEAGIDPGASASSREQRIAELCEQKRLAFEQLVSDGIEPIPGAIELLDEAVEHLPVAIASGATMADIDLILRCLGRRDAVEVIVSADHVRRSKPDPQSYALAVEQLAARHPELALQPSECLAIEDTAAGLASARGAGLMTLGLTTTGPADKLAAAHRIIPGLEDVNLKQLQAWFG